MSKRWKCGEDLVIIKNYGMLSSLELSKKLNRSQSSITNRIKILKDLGKLPKTTISEMTKKINSGRLDRIEKRLSERYGLSIKDLLYDFYRVKKYSQRQLVIEFGLGLKTIRKLLYKYNIPIFTPSEAVKLQWKRKRKSNIHNGQRELDGYVQIRVTTHPNANSSGYVYEHRLIIENKIGRYLTKDEVVHHIDHDIKNNDPENLMLFPDSASHHKYHGETNDFRQTKDKWWAK